MVQGRASVLEDAAAEAADPHLPEARVQMGAEIQRWARCCRGRKSAAERRERRRTQPPLGRRRCLITSSPGTTSRSAGAADAVEGTRGRRPWGFREYASSSRSNGVSAFDLVEPRARRASAAVRARHAGQRLQRLRAGARSQRSDDRDARVRRSVGARATARRRLDLRLRFRGAVEPASDPCLPAGTGRRLKSAVEADDSGARPRARRRVRQRIVSTPDDDAAGAERCADSEPAARARSGAQTRRGCPSSIRRKARSSAAIGDDGNPMPINMLPTEQRAQLEERSRPLIERMAEINRDAARFQRAVLRDAEGRSTATSRRAPLKDCWPGLRDRFSAFPQLTDWIDALRRDRRRASRTAAHERRRRGYGRAPIAANGATRSTCWWIAAGKRTRRSSANTTRHTRTCSGSSSIGSCPAVDSIPT